MFSFQRIQCGMMFQSCVSCSFILRMLRAKMALTRMGQTSPQKKKERGKLDGASDQVNHSA